MIEAVTTVLAALTILGGVWLFGFVVGTRLGSRHVNERRREERSLTRSLAASRGKAYMADEEGYQWSFEWSESKAKRRPS